MPYTTSPFAHCHTIDALKSFPCTLHHSPGIPHLRPSPLHSAARSLTQDSHNLSCWVHLTCCHMCTYSSPTTLSTSSQPSSPAAARFSMSHSTCATARAACTAGHAAGEGSPGTCRAPAYRPATASQITRHERQHGLVGPLSPTNLCFCAELCICAPHLAKRRQPRLMRLHHILPAGQAVHALHRYRTAPA